MILLVFRYELEILNLALQFSALCWCWLIMLDKSVENTKYALFCFMNLALGRHHEQCTQLE
jgi:hypothetical protein